MTDKAKKLLMLYEQSGKRKTLKSVPPLTFKGYGKDLKNYRIYGQTVDGESVGDRTGNILPMSTTPIDTIIDDFHCEYDGMGTIKLTALTDNAVLSGFTVPLSKNFTIPVSIGQGGTGCWQMNNDAAYNNADNNTAFCLNLKDDTQLRDNWTLSAINRISDAYRAMGGANINSIQILTTVGAVTNIQSGQTLTISPAFVENISEQVPFEPYGYRVPVTVSNGTDTQTTTIYLDAPLAKSGNNADYIDYATQKRHNSDGTESSVTLPEISTLAGTNTLTVGTEVQPSKVEIAGKIKQIEGEDKL